jgi:hypothetical protein
MIGHLMCLLGLHRVVTTREGKVPGSVKRGTPEGAAGYIHCFCHRADCKYHVIIDTHSGEKMLHVDANGSQVHPPVAV